MKIAIIVMATVIIILVYLVVIFKYEADFWKEVAEVKEKMQR